MERGPLDTLADELHDAFSARGYKIEVATGLDPAFRRTKRPQSSLGRDLVLSTIEATAPSLGLSTAPVSGGSLEVAMYTAEAVYMFRVLKARFDAECAEYRIIINSKSMLEVQTEEGAFLLPQRWVLGYTVTADGILDQVFAAEVLGATGNGPYELKLGPVMLLGTTFGPNPSGPSTGFQPSDEDDLFGDDEGEATNTGS